MKKILLSVIIMILFLFSSRVNALTNNGKIYEVFYGESGVNVFAKDMTYNSMDYNGWMLVSDSDNYIYYCVDPATYMQNISDAKSNTHTVIEGNSNIMNSLKISESLLNRIKLLAYYGYGYKDNAIDHTDKKWYGITQVLIWQEVRTDITWRFKTSRYGTVNNGLYFNEKGELLTLVYNHSLQPNFNKKEVNMLVGEELTLIDDNNVLKSFNVKDDEYASYKIDGNKLIINAKKSGSLKVDLYRQKVENNFNLLTSNSLQDLIIRGKVDSYDSYIDLKISDGNLVVNKVNEQNEFSTNLIGSEFGIYDINNNLIKQVIINNSSEQVDLSFGDYYLLELKSSLGYELNTTKYYFSITNKQNKVKVSIPNKIIKGDLKIIKKDYDLNKPISNTLIGIYKDDNTLVKSMYTSDDGVIYLSDLLYGKYYIQELESSTYYRLNDEKMYFEINSNNLVELEMYNYKKQGTIIITKKDYDTKEQLFDALIEVYNENNELICSGYTDTNGQIILEKFNAGKYYIIEKEAPYGYILNKEKIYFELIEDNQNIELEIFNKKIEMPNTYKTINNMYIFTAMLFIPIVILYLRKYDKKENK